MGTKLKHCKYTFCETNGSPHLNEEICCSCCEWFDHCGDRCDDEDGFCKDEHRTKRNMIIGIAVAAVFICGYLIWFTVHEWNYLTADTAEFEKPAATEPATDTTAAIIEKPIATTTPPMADYSAVAPADNDTVMIARLIYGEAGGIPSTMERAAVAWCVLNRVDNPNYPSSIEGVILQTNQFYGYSTKHPATDENIAIAQDVMLRYQLEKIGVGSGGRVLPADYVYFTGDGIRNYFEADYHSGVNWDWSMPNPYED
jgi:hypothetical protein